MELALTLIEIKEDSFTSNEALIGDPEKAFISQIGFDLFFNSQEEVFMVMGKIAYVTAQEETAAELTFHYKVRVAGIATLQPDGEAVKVEGYKLPKYLIDTAIGDAYASGRLMMSYHMKDTRLENVYLPFGGASQFLQRLGSH